MTRVAVTSVVRHAGTGEADGFLRIVDLDSERVAYKTVVPPSSYRATDPNPRGGLRGARGVAVYGDLLVIANAERLFVLDTSWRLAREITHPWLSAIHDVLPESDGIWVTCSNCDRLVKVSWDGELLETWSWRNDKTLVRALGFRSVPRPREDLDFRDPAAMQGGVHNIAHLNGVSRGRKGLIISLGRVLNRRTLASRRAKGRLGRAAGAVGFIRGPTTKNLVAGVPRTPGSRFAIVRLRQNGAEPQRWDTEVLLQDENLTRPNHNPIETVEGKLIWNDSNGGALIRRDPATRVNERVVMVPGSPSFPRGLAQLDGDLFVVGSQAAIHTIDLTRGRLISSLDIDGARHEAVHGISILPHSFGDPGHSIFDG
jgi:hypothetical protein